MTLSRHSCFKQSIWDIDNEIEMDVFGRVFNVLAYSLTVPASKRQDRARRNVLGCSVSREPSSGNVNIQKTNLHKLLV